MSRVEVNPHLASRVNGLKDELISRLQASGAEPGSTVSVFPLPCKSIHQIGIVEISGKKTLLRCLVKGNVPNYLGAQKLDMEHYVLSQIAPQISALNAKTRCPRALAFFPREELLFLELIEGRDLKSILFDLVPSRPDLPQLLRLTGEWLAHLHRDTREGEGNPFDWLEDRFDADRIRGTFEKCGARHLYRAVRHLLQTFRRAHKSFTRPLCQLHGEFTPLHVLVRDDSIYVIDFGSTARGFACEDVALFTTFYENLQPWRSVAGWIRVPFRKQKSSFLAAYNQYCGQEFNRIDDVVTRFTQIWAMARHEFFWERQPANLPEQIYLTFGRTWMRNRFVGFASREIRRLQTLTSSTLVPVFDRISVVGESGAAVRPRSLPNVENA